MTLIMNERAEFVDMFDPNPDEQRLRAYGSLRKLDPAKMRPAEGRREERGKRKGVGA